MNTEVFDLGKIGITLGGEYNNKVIYEKLTIVLYKGKSYISTKTVQGISPEQDTLIWQLVAEAKDAYNMLVDAGKTTLTEEEFLEQLVDATKGRYIVQGNIINAADEEDLTVEHSDLLGIDTLKLADRDNTNGMGYIILRKNKSFKEQVIKENTIYEIRYDFNLFDEIVTIPKNCVLKYNGGSTNNGTINCNNTLLLGRVNVSKITGTVSNKIVYTSWFSDNDFSEIAASVFNSNSTLQLDKNIVMNGTVKDVYSLKIEGNGYTIFNSCKYRITSNNIIINNVSFKEITECEVFITFNTEADSAALILNNVEFNGNDKCKRFFNWYDTTKELDLRLNIVNCKFHNISSVVFKHGGTSQGFIKNNEFYSIGSLDNIGEVFQAGVILGRSDRGDRIAKNVIISNNSFRNIKAPYLTGEDVKETHAILLFGNNCIIENNLIENIYSLREDKDPGTETEGIYVKGSYNKIVKNVLIDAAGGTNSDGAITLKSIPTDTDHNCNNNIISDNTITFTGYYGIGITSYGTNSNIINNIINLGTSQGSAVEFLIAKDSLIKDNIINSKPGVSATGKKAGRTAFAINNDCSNLVFKNNTLHIATLVKSYNSKPSTIVFEDNNIFIIGNNWGTNSNHSSLCITNKTIPNILFNNNYVEIVNSRASAFWDGNCKLLAKNNYFKLEQRDDSEILTAFSGMFRTLDSVILIDNIFDIDNNVNVIPPIFFQMSENSIGISHNTIFTKASMSNNKISRNATNVLQKTIGTTEDRNNIRLNYNACMEGYQFFDITLGKPCYAKSINYEGIVHWVDATGADI